MIGRSGHAGDKLEFPSAAADARRRAATASCSEGKVRGESNQRHLRKMGFGSSDDAWQIPDRAGIRAGSGIAALVIVALVILGPTGGEAFAAGESTRVPSATDARATLHAKSFRSPSGHIRCSYTTTVDGPQLLCVVDTVKDSNGAYGMMYADGPVDVGPVDDFGVGRTRAVLHCDQQWSRGGMSCKMARSGITCRDRDGHGFKLSRKRQSTF